MPDLFIRNLPAELHTRLKAAAAAHRRSVTQETIATLEAGLRVAEPPFPPVALPDPVPLLPPPILPQGSPVSTETLFSWIDEGQR